MVQSIDFWIKVDPRIGQNSRCEAQSRSWESAQDDKWNFCLTTAIIAANRRDHQQTRRRGLWKCRFAWTTQTRCPHTHSRRKSSSTKLLDLKGKGRRDHTLTSATYGSSPGSISLGFSSVSRHARVLRQSLPTPIMGRFDGCRQTDLVVRRLTIRTSQRLIYKEIT